MAQGYRHPHYHGWPAYPYPYPQGFCHSCCHPVSQCLCGWRECRKEAKELLVSPERKINERALGHGLMGSFSKMLPDELMQRLADMGATSDTTYIGGGCCVHLSVEYGAEADGAVVAVGVLDTDMTALAWAKLDIARGYYIKEGIITTNPGAELLVAVVKAVARVRWCEVFSC